MSYRTEKVQLMPTELRPGVLYVSDEFGIAIHLCACGCGEKVKTPLGPTEWSVSETPAGPTVHPSIGNWQQPCGSHYFIRNGRIMWAGRWTPEAIEEGRAEEFARRTAYYGDLHQKQWPWFRRLWNVVMRKIFGGGA